MKRDHMIERLLVLSETKEQKIQFKRELDNKSNENLRAVYEQLRPKLEARQEQIDKVVRRAKRRKQLEEKWRQHNEACSAWSKRWKRPQEAIPIAGRYERIPGFTIEPTPQPELSFGALIGYMKSLVYRSGSIDAIATLRFLRVSSSDEGFGSEESHRSKVAAGS